MEINTIYLSFLMFMVLLFYLNIISRKNKSNRNIPITLLEFFYDTLRGKNNSYNIM